MRLVENRISIFLACTIAFLVCGCKQSETEKKETPQQRDAKILSQPAEAIPEIEARLSGWVHREGDFIFARDEAAGRFFNLYILPAPATWMVDCGLGGITVTLGAWSEGGNEGSSSVIQHQITNAALSEQQCTVFGVAIAKKMKALVQ
jgi:hypothetical protein